MGYGNGALEIRSPGHRFPFKIKVIEKSNFYFKVFYLYIINIKLKFQMIF